MQYPCASRHYLYITRFCSSLVALGVLVGYSALSDIGNNFHILMRMHRKPSAWLNGIIINYSEITKTHSFWVIVIGKTKMIMGVKPTIIGTSQRTVRVNGYHFISISEHELKGY